jgi:hypothetical protein
MISTHRRNIIGSGSTAWIYKPSDAYAEYLDQRTGYIYGGNYVIKKARAKKPDIIDVYKEIKFQDFAQRSLEGRVAPLVHWICDIERYKLHDFRRIDSHVEHEVDIREEDDTFKLWVDPPNKPMDLLKRCASDRIGDEYECLGVLMTMPRLDGDLIGIGRTDPVASCIDILIQCMTILRDLHAIGIKHGDCGRQNWLYKKGENNEYYVMISDFGRSSWIRYDGDISSDFIQFVGCCSILADRPMPKDVQDLLHTVREKCMDADTNLPTEEYILSLLYRMKSFI